MYDYSKLNGRIVEVCGNQGEFAKRMGLSERTISLKMQQKNSFKQSDIEKAINVLKLSAEDISLYFFSLKSSMD